MGKHPELLRGRVEPPLQISADRGATPITDPKLIAKLDKRVTTMSSKKDEGTLWLAVPDIIDWDEFDSFGITDVPKPIKDQEDLFRRLITECFDGTAPSLDALKKARVVMKRTDNRRPTWSLYRCMYAEVIEKGHTHVLNGGQWYQVADDLVKQVDATVKSLPKSSLIIPPWKSTADEAAFNKSLTAANKGATLCDRKLTSLGGTNLEMCDVLAAAGELVHVKKYAGSAVLSHLFAQGQNSAEAMTDADFRSRVAKQVGVPSLATSTWDPLKRPVVFLVGTRSTKPLKLPFFSRLTLHNTVRRLRALRHEVQLDQALIA